MANSVQVYMQRRIENSEWDWRRWPALKIFEIQNIGYGHKEDLLNVLSIDFKQCPTLEIVSFCVSIDFADLFANCPKCVAIIGKLAFNPQIDMTQFRCVDHIWSLGILEQDDEVFKLINKNVKGVKELSVSEVSYLNDLVEIDSLLELDIDFSSTSDVTIGELKQLKILTVPKLDMLKNLIDMDSLLKLSVTHVTERELKEYDLTNIIQCFKRLQKFDIFIHVDVLKPEEYAEIVDHVFQNSAIRVEIGFSKCSSTCPRSTYTTYLTKEPFQKCVFEL